MLAFDKFHCYIEINLMGLWARGDIVKIIATIIGAFVLGYILLESGVVSALLLLLVAGIVPGTDYTLSPVIMMISSGALLTVLFSYLAFFSTRHEDIEMTAPKVTRHKKPAAKSTASLARRKKRPVQKVAIQPTGDAILTNQTV